MFYLHFDLIFIADMTAWSVGVCYCFMNAANLNKQYIAKLNGCGKIHYQEFDCNHDNVKLLYSGTSK